MEARLQGQTSHHVGGLLAGDPSLLLGFAQGTLAFLAPLWLIYAAIFGIPRRGMGKGRGPCPSSGSADGHASLCPSYASEVRRLLDRFHLLVLVSAVLISLFIGIDHLKSRWLHPFLTLVPFWWLLHAAGGEPRGKAWPILKWVTVGVTLLVVVARLWQLLATPYVGKKPSRVTWPVVEAASQLPVSLLKSPDLRVADSYLAAHIRLITHRPVRVSLPDAVRPQQGIWVWGGLAKDLPSWAARLQQANGVQARWYHAAKGRAEYWIGCIGSRPGLERLCGQQGD